ncbi:MAG: hypothetical protein ACW99G_09695 [Candidatus Thorarchaeota archaeon]|jgi:hypothetical protein
MEWRDYVIIILLIIIVFLLLEGFRILQIIPGLGEKGPDFAVILKDIFRN